MQTEPKAHTQTRKKASAATTHLKNVLNMLVMPEFSGAAGVSELDGGDEAGDVTEEDEQDELVVVSDTGDITELSEDNLHSGKTSVPDP